MGSEVTERSKASEPLVHLLELQLEFSLPLMDTKRVVAIGRGLRAVANTLLHVLH